VRVSIGVPRLPPLSLAVRKTITAAACFNAFEQYYARSLTINRIIYYVIVLLCYYFVCIAVIRQIAFVFTFEFPPPKKNAAAMADDAALFARRKETG